MRYRQRFDVLVVGARCAGAATAMLMARHGLRVLAVERGFHGADTVSTHALMRGGVLQLHRWGILPRLQALGTRAVRRTSFHYGDDVLEIDIQPSHGIDALYAPRRTVLDSVLADAAVAAGATVWFGHSLVDLIRRPDGRICGGVVVDQAGSATPVEADLVVGADGIGSTVARLTRAPILREGQHRTAAVFGYFPEPRPTGYHWYYGCGSSAGVIPTNAGEQCVVVSLRPEDLRQATWRHGRKPVFIRTLRQLDPALADTLDGPWAEASLRVFGGRTGFLRRARGPGWALVGDAGYFRDPLTAHGITDALRDAELLANAAVEGTASAFAAYGETRDALSIPLFEISDAIASFAWDIDAIRLLHQQLNRAMKQEVAHIAALPPIPARGSVDAQPIRESAA